MKITFLVTSATGGSAELPVIQRIASGLADRGHQTSVLPAVESIDPRDTDKAPSVLVPPEWSPAFTYDTDEQLRAELNALRTDVLITVGIGPLSAAARLTSVRVPLVHLVIGGAGSAHDADAMMLLAPRISQIVAVARESAAWLHELFAGSGPPVQVISHPLGGDDATRFRPRSTLNTRLIVAVDRNAQRGANRQLIRAFGMVANDLPGWRLRIVGSGRAPIGLQRSIRKAGLYDRVEMLDPDDQMAEEWVGASIAAHVDTTNWLFHDIHESRAAGVPSVAHDTPAGASDLIRHEETGLLVAADSAAGMSSALFRLATDDGLRHQMGDAAVRAEQSDTLDQSSQRWEEVLKAARQSPGGNLRATGSATVCAPEPATPRRTPAEARQYCLGVAVQAATKVSARWFVIPPNAEGSPAVVVPMADQTPFLAALAELVGDAGEINLTRPAEFGWPESVGTVADQAERFSNARLPRLWLAPSRGTGGRPGLLSYRCGVELEFWDETHQGDLQSRQPNRYLNGLASDITFVPFSVEGVDCRTVEVMTKPTVYDCCFPVDVVYTWVDGGDPAWAQSRLEALGEATGAAVTRESSGLARFTDHNELRFSMRSVHLFAPWVRQIYLVTAGQRPGWLEDHPKVQLVDHREILPESALPTFNSHAIETSLHRIPGLAEQWIYLNDDVFFGRPVRPEQFFSGSGQPYVFPNPIGVGDPALSLKTEPWRRAAWNNRALLEEAFGLINPTAMRHTPHPQRRGVVEEMESRFPAAFAQTRQAPFRSEADISTLSSLAQHYGLATGQSAVGSIEDEFVNISGSDVVGRLRRLLAREQDTFCLGDHHDYALKPHKLEAILTEFFEEYFPIAAPWERGADRG